MKLKLRITYWLIAIMIILLTFWLGFFRKQTETQAEEKIVPVEVITVDTNSIEETLELTGWIEANKVVNIASKVAGRIESLALTEENENSIPVEEGTLVKKGQQIAAIDHDTYLAQLKSAQAQLQASKAELDDAIREKERITSLYKSGSTTEQNKDKAVTAAELAQAKLESAEAALELAGINLRESTITSPINGVVTNKHIDEGNLIRVGDPIVTVKDINTVKILIATAERYLPVIKVGMPSIIKIDAFAEKIFEAKVYSIHPDLDPQTHSIQVEIRVQNENHKIKPGMFARVKLILNKRDNTIVIPRDVVLGGKINPHYVYTVKDNVTHKKIVKVGITQGPNYEITDGLEKGQTLVVNGMNFLTEGSNVEIVNLEKIK